MQNFNNPHDCEEIELETIGCLRENNEECLSIAMAYVPWQRWGEIYTSEVGLQRGTIFKELDKPYLSEEVM